MSVGVPGKRTPNALAACPRESQRSPVQVTKLVNNKHHDKKIHFLRHQHQPFSTRHRKITFRHLPRGIISVNQKKMSGGSNSNSENSRSQPLKNNIRRKSLERLKGSSFSTYLSNIRPMNRIRLNKVIKNNLAENQGRLTKRQCHDLRLNINHVTDCPEKQKWKKYVSGRRCNLKDSRVDANSRRISNRFEGTGYLWLLLLLVMCATVQACRYAAIDPRHTMCSFMPKQCPGKMLIRTGELTCHDKERILTKHNMLRQEAALGQVRGQPAAINMKTMVWDDELAMVAQRWADQCMPGHDRSRNTQRFAAGQNVAAVWTYDRDEGHEPDFLTQVEAWFMEVDQHGFSKGAVDPFKFSKPTGHYTQLVWAETYLVGCGYTYYHDAAGNGYTKLYVCNYGPGGNVVGGSMYKVGYPGQPYCVGNGLRPSTDYQGLCEEDGVNYKSMCAMGGSSMFHKPKTSSIMMMMDGNSVMEDFAHSHARPTSPTHPLDVMHPDPPHMQMHDMMHHHSSMMRSGSHAQQSHMMMSPSHHHEGNGLMKSIQEPFSGLVNALSPWNFLNRFNK
ncbi:uncharacterized protein LOC108681306 [Hyalella azteca]|uniref:Uncharacterized protein LOC108681306 n=1 Tax=Hyalella azteca TaxID=294128 RepID=A0A8B7PK37_HYAAZ|nr:uncharacterized protein LOC108681306 [Hyalella azteca]